MFYIFKVIIEGWPYWEINKLLRKKILYENEGHGHLVTKNLILPRSIIENNMKTEMRILVLINPPS